MPLIIILIIVSFILVCFSGVLLFGAPFLPTLKPQINQALELLDLETGQTMIELGCGDGRVLIAAAKQGISSIGYELNPVLVIVAKVRTWQYRQHISIIWGNFWTKEWPPTDAVFCFLLPRYMTKLHKKIVQYPTKPIKVVSFAFPIPGKRPDKVKAGVFLYKYN
jgi:16S rRNA A1518/A1519 N6-dimethyltransferase RsmA/KsgA/DIM1 with predicted DNA glycosylase/AP lyase activity